MIRVTNPQRYIQLRPKPAKLRSKHLPLCKIMQNKEDGYRVTIIRTDDGELSAIGRKLDYIEELRDNPSLSKQIEQIPCNTVMDGELFVPDVAATSVITAIKERGDLRFSPFAIPIHEGIDLREMPLEEYWRVNCIAHGYGFKIPSYCNCSFSSCFDLRTLADMALEAKIEGYVLKAGHWDSWYKIKPCRTADLVITGVKWSEAITNIGLLGSIICSAYDESGKLKEVGAMSGMTAEEREMMTELHEDEELCGKVVEVKYETLASKGRLKFASFVRFRDDKPASECYLSQLQ